MVNPGLWNKQARDPNPRLDPHIPNPRAVNPKPLKGTLLQNPMVPLNGI